MEEERNKIYTTVAIVVLVGILVSCVAGVLAGGVAGFLVGRREGRLAAERALESAWYDLRGLPLEVPEPWQEEQPVPMPPSEERERPLTGAVILQVISDTAADKAGLEAGDMILAIDRTPVDRNHPLSDIIAQYKPGDRVTVHLWRAGLKTAVQVTLTQHPDDPGRAYLGIYFRMVQEPQSEPPQD